MHSNLNNNIYYFVSVQCLIHYYHSVQLQLTLSDMCTVEKAANVT